MKNKPLIISIIFFSLLASCSGVRIYQNMADRNLQIHTAVDTGSFLSKVRAYLYIYNVERDRNPEYEGAVQLNRGSVEVGIPYGRLSYLVFVFSSSNFLLNSSGTISYDTLLRPHASYINNVNLSYNEDIYNIALRERNLNEMRIHKIELKDLSSSNLQINY